MLRTKIVVISGIIAIIATVAFVSLNNDVQEQVDDNPESKADIENSDFKVEDVLENSVDMTDPSRNVQEEIVEKYEEIEEQRSENPNYEPAPREWLTSGPFQIDRSEYLLGEKVFIRIQGLDPNVKGQIAFLRPLNDTHYSVYLTIPFDGKKPAFNYYFEPRLAKFKNVCSEEDLIGDWKVVFRGTEHPNISFEIVNKTIPGTEDDFYTNVC